MKITPVPPNVPSAALVPDASRIQDKVVLAETVGLTRNNPDYYALVLGNHVLGGGFSTTRLYQQLREETGLVYTVEVELEANKTRALYAVDYGCNPGNVDKARTIVYRNLVEMQNKPVTPEELRQAQAMLLRQIPLAESSLDNITEGLLKRSTLDLPLDEPTVAAHRYVALTSEQVKAAFAKWLRPTDLVQVVQGPAPH